MDRDEILSGVVVSQMDGRLLVAVETEAEAGCHGCAAHGLCGAGKRGRFEIRLDALSGDRHSPGDLVRFAYRPPHPILSPLVLFLPTLAGLFLGGGLAQALVGGGDRTFVIGSLAGLAGGFGLALLLTRRLSFLRAKTRLTDGDGGIDNEIL